MSVKDLIENSVFNRERYIVNIEVKSFVRSLMFYIDDTVEEQNQSISGLFKKGIPLFQRDNDKWDLSRQISFVENLISGYRPTIQLYTTQDIFDERGQSRCWILDGLQRITAILKFIDGDFNLFDGQLSFEDAWSEHLIRRAMVNLEIFTFDDDIEAAQFYVQLNKGITHSEKDIQRALDFIKLNKSEA